MLDKLLYNRQYRPYWKILFWLIFLTLLGLTLSPQVPQPIKLQNIDKLYHFVAFAGFAFIYRVAYQRLENWLIIVIASLVGVGIEIAQAFIPGRGFSFADMLADGTGVVVGWWIARWSALRYTKVQDGPVLD